MVYDALQKRTAYLDALARGLELLGVKTAISLFPEVFKAAFVSDGKVWPYQVAAMLKPAVPIDVMDTNQTRVWRFLLNFVDKAESAGVYLYLLWYYRPESHCVPCVTDLKAFIQFVT